MTRPGYLKIYPRFDLVWGDDIAMLRTQITIITYIPVEYRRKKYLTCVKYSFSLLPVDLFSKLGDEFEHFHDKVAEAKKIEISKFHFDNNLLIPAP